MVLFLNAYKSIEVANEIIGTAVQTKSHLSLSLLLGHLYQLEFLPIHMSVIFFLFGNHVKKKGYFTFWSLQGYNLHRRLLLFLFSFSFLISLLATTYAGYFIPNYLNKEIKILPYVFKVNFLNNPDKYIQPRKIAKLGNYFIHVDKVVIDYINNKTRWNFQEVSVFDLSESENRKQIMKCNRISITSTVAGSIKFYKCLRGQIYHNLNYISIRPWSKIIKKSDLLTQYKKYQLEKNQISLPYLVKKYTYSITFIWDFIRNKPCPGGIYEILDKLFYFLSFFIYSFTAYLIAIKLLFNFGFLPKALILLLYTLALPFLSLLFQVSNTKLFNIFEITYTIPLIVAILIILIFLFKKPKAFLFYKKCDVLLRRLFSLRNTHKGMNK